MLQITANMEDLTYLLTTARTLNITQLSRNMINRSHHLKTIFTVKLPLHHFPVNVANADFGNPKSPIHSFKCYANAKETITRID